jgi:hypothetical protein
MFPDGLPGMSTIISDDKHSSGRQGCVCACGIGIKSLSSSSVFIALNGEKIPWVDLCENSLATVDMFSIDIPLNGGSESLNGPARGIFTFDSAARPIHGCAKTSSHVSLNSGVARIILDIKSWQSADK